jgi:hypothetical protein
MALSDEDKKEFLELMGQGVAAGLTLFRSQQEEAAAKDQAGKDDTGKEGGKSGETTSSNTRIGYGIADYFMGRK